MLGPEDVANSILLSVGINPSDNKPYIDDPQEHYLREGTFLENWWNDLSPDRKQLFDEIRESTVRNNVVESGFSDESGKSYYIDDKGYIHPTVQTYTKQTASDDPVDKPAHYRQGNIEAIDYLKDNLPIEAYIGGCEWNVKKYLHRWRYKSKPLEDLKKARWYLDKLIEAMEGK